MELIKAREMKNAKISFVSLVDKAANKKRFLITKAEGGGAGFNSNGNILKVDNDTHYITGIVYEPLKEDAHGDFMTAEEISKAAYWFAKNGDKVDIQHSFVSADGISVVESYITPCDMDIGGETIIKGTWVMTVEVQNADVWESVQKGEITGFSMGGVGVFAEEDIDLDNIKKDDDVGTHDEKKGLFKRLAGLFGLDVVEKGAVSDKWRDEARGSRFWAAFRAVQDVLSNYDSSTGTHTYETDESVVRAALNEFSEIVTTILVDERSGVMKSIIENKPKKTINKEEKQVDENTLQTMIDAAVTKAVEAISKKEDNKMEDGLPLEEGILEGEDVQKMIDKAVEKAVGNMGAAVEKAVEKALDPLLKSRGLAQNINDEEPVEKSKNHHYLDGIL